MCHLCCLPLCERVQSPVEVDPLVLRLTATRLNSSVSRLQVRVKLFLFFRSNMLAKVAVRLAG